MATMKPTNKGTNTSLFSSQFVELTKQPWPIQLYVVVNLLLQQVSTLRLIEYDENDQQKVLESSNLKDSLTSEETGSLLTSILHSKFQDIFDSNANVVFPSESTNRKHEDILQEIEHMLNHFRSSATLNTTIDVTLNHLDKSLTVDVSRVRELSGQSVEELIESRDLSVTREPPELEIQPDAYFSAAETAEFLNVAKSTVTRRINANELVGFKLFRHALHIPKQQFLNHDVIPGVSDVLQFFVSSPQVGSSKANHMRAWMFLAGKLDPGDSNSRPIDRLRNAASEGNTQSVLAELKQSKNSLDWGDHL